MKPWSYNLEKLDTANQKKLRNILFSGSFLCAYIHDDSFSSLSFSWHISTCSSQFTIAFISFRNLPELPHLYWVFHLHSPIHKLTSIKTLKTSSGNYQCVCLPIWLNTSCSKTKTTKYISALCRPNTKHSTEFMQNKKMPWMLKQWVCGL